MCLISLLLFPIGGNLREVVGEDERGATGIRTAHHSDFEPGQFEFRVQCLDGGVIPAGDFAQENAGQHILAESELVILHTRGSR